VQSFLDPLPVRRLHGVGPATEKALAEMGVQTVADLRAAIVEDLTDRFGKHGRVLFEFARGIDDRAVETHQERKSLGTENTYVTDLADLAEMEAEVERMAAEVADALSRRGFAACTVTLKARYADFTTITRSRTLSSPSTRQPPSPPAPATCLRKTDAPAGPSGCWASPPPTWCRGAWCSFFSLDERYGTSLAKDRDRYVLEARRLAMLTPLRWAALIVLLVALVAAVVGFGGLPSGAAGIAKLLFTLFLIVFVVSLVAGARPPGVSREHRRTMSKITASGPRIVAGFGRLRPSRDEICWNLLRPEPPPEESPRPDAKLHTTGEGATVVRSLALNGLLILASFTRCIWRARFFFPSSSPCC